jgi:alpha-beta hydrolase superfamily lysophospholipase
MGIFLLRSTPMNRFRFPLAVAMTSLALVLVAIGVGGLLVNNALANSPLGGAAPWTNGPWAGHGGWQSNNLPPELAGLTDIPASERFQHFRGVRVQLADKDNKPLTADILPGTVTNVSQTSLTLAANDGTTHTFTLDDKTVIHARSAAQGSTQAAPAVSQSDKVIVASLNNSTTATAVIAFNPDGFGPHGPAGR